MEICNKPEVDICLVPTPQARVELSRPYGMLIVDKDCVVNVTKGRRIITVGDYVTKIFEDRNVKPFLSIIDGKTMRNKSMEDEQKGDEVIENEAGILRLSSMEVVKRKIDGKGGRLFVKGEEDMLAIACILFANEGDTVVYGQPRAGSVVVIVDGMIKWRVKDILSKFERKECQTCAGSSSI